MNYIVRSAITLLCAGLLSAPPSEANVITACWKAWSRCSRWSSWFTGKLWLTCYDKCRRLGKSRGRCVLTPTACPLAREAYQCQCS
uniref:Uncharacterized protein n=1 Tax=Biomphalaria glabrata TaxID=6526 RepID=A0A182YU74_BIOGL